jgi:preprotein translocase subunit SecG
MTAFLVVLHVLVCLFLVLFVLLQPGARGGVGAAFGGAGGQTVFGGRGANTFLAKLTAGAAVIFMLTSITLSFFGSSSTSVMANKGKPAVSATAKPEDAKPEGEAKAVVGEAKPADSVPVAPVGDAPAAPVGEAPPAP